MYLWNRVLLVFFLFIYYYCVCVCVHNISQYISQVVKRLYCFSNYVFVLQLQIDFKDCQTVSVFLMLAQGKHRAEMGTLIKSKLLALSG